MEPYEHTREPMQGRTDKGRRGRRNQLAHWSSWMFSMEDVQLGQKQSTEYCNWKGFWYKNHKITKVGNYPWRLSCLIPLESKFKKTTFWQLKVTWTWLNEKPLKISKNTTIHRKTGQRFPAHLSRCLACTMQAPNHDWAVCYPEILLTLCTLENKSPIKFKAS